MKNKVGDTIAFLVLDDRSARFEFSLFAKEYEKYRETLNKDVIMVVECAVSIDDYNGGMRGRGKSVMTLAQARKRNAHRVALNLESELLGSNFCEHLARILEPYRKTAEVLEVEDAAIANGSGVVLLRALVLVINIPDSSRPVATQYGGRRTRERAARSWCAISALTP